MDYYKLKNINRISELRNIEIRNNDVFFTVLTTNNREFTFSLNNLLSGNPKLAENFMSDIATLILKDFENIRDIEESIKILSENKEGIKFLFRDERLGLEFIILLGNESISIFNPENDKKIITSEYNLDMARIAMMNIFLSNFYSDIPHIFYNYFEGKFYPVIPHIFYNYFEGKGSAKNDIDLATPIFSAVDYNLIMDDFITYFNRLENFVSRDNIKNLIRPFVRSGWTGAVKFILDNTPDNVIRSNDYNIMFRNSNDVVYEIILDMIQSNDQEMFDFVFDEFMPKYGYNNEIDYTDLVFMIIDSGTVEQFEYLTCKLPSGIDLVRLKDNLFGVTLLFDAIVAGKNDIAKYMILKYDIDPNEEFGSESYITISVKNGNIEIFKLLINKDDLVLSEEDRKLIESEAESNEEIRAIYEEYLERNGFKIAINDFDQDKGHSTGI